MTRFGASRAQASCSCRRIAGSLSEIVDLMVEHRVGWSQTFSIYEASRDVVRAQDLP